MNNQFCESVYPTITVSDLQQTVEYYHRELGFDIQFKWGEPPVHAGVTFGKATLHFNQQDMETNYQNELFWLYFQVEDVDDLFEKYQSRTVSLLDEPTDREWGMREFNVRDVNGLSLRFGQPNVKFGEPIKVTRTDINARIETRLANLLSDLAGHKNMTIGEVIEETLLHSFEQTDGHSAVASPHTQRTMQFIDDLKMKHGIDYQTHDAYRFIEDQ